MAYGPVDVGGVEGQARTAHPDEVRGRVGERAVRAEERDLDLLAWPNAASGDRSVGRVPAGHDRPAVLTRRARDLAVDPHLGVVVDGGFEDGRRPGRIEGADALRHRDADPIPTEAEASAATPLGQGAGCDRLPGGVVEVGAPRARLEGARVDWRPSGLTLRIGRAVPRRDDLHVRGAPGAVHEIGPRGGRQVDRGERLALGCSRSRPSTRARGENQETCQSKRTPHRAAPVTLTT